MMINPRVDIAFKKIFGVEENSDILISLLNAIVSENDQIDEVELLNPYNERHFKKDKLSILDIKARNKHTKTYFLVEMQLAEEVAYHKRGLYGWARIYSNQLKKGDFYDKLTKTIAIHFLNFTCIEHKADDGFTVLHKEKYHHCFTPMDKETHKQIHDDFEIHTIELSKFENGRQRDLDIALSKVKTLLDAWVAVLTHYDLLNLKALPKELNKPEIKKALNIMEEMTMTGLEREQYDAHLDFLRMEKEAFEARYLKGKAEGLAEGEAKGKAEGLAEGKAKGKAEGFAEGKVQIAETMLNLGVEAKTIAQYTGLSIHEVERLGAPHLNNKPKKVD